MRTYGIVHIEMIHTGSDEHYLTAYSESGEALMSIDSDANITNQPMDGERVTWIATISLTPIPGADLTTTDPLEEALILAAREEWGEDLR